ncbi:hypothetical protein NA56DRAFT_317470 [Hyaloscypha hepaticicola]|uniref:Uncharacterized protein n=1 Tax=Hyaloscypha hepaticicola TaxID=2082293 RepID=A0A2J6PQW4_9HELO|nr:hypothetical protein NA56DRAFT_317470 [Hyaloscypha hepaticicola]
MTKLGSNPYYFHSDKGSPLFMAVDASPPYKVPINLISRLLDLGLDPNEKNQSGVTPWHRFFAMYLDGSTEFRLSCVKGGPKNSVFSIFFLRKGAHKTCRIYHKYGGNVFPATHFIRKAFEVEDGTMKNILNIFDDFLAGSQEQSKLQLEEILSKLKRPQPPPHSLRMAAWESFLWSDRKEHIKTAALMEKIISKGNELKIGMEFIVPLIEDSFGNLNSASLVAMIRNNKKQVSKSSPTCASAKRSRDNQSGDSSQDQKRIKPEGSSYYREIQVEGKQSVVIEIL